MTALRRLSAALPAALLLAASASTSALACACGCGVFGVGTASLFPTGSGGQAWFEYDYMNQDRNRSGERGSAPANNADRQIETDFLNLGGQYMFNRSWGVTVEVPYWRRTFRTVVDADSGAVSAARHDALGDIRLMGMYTGVSPDMSTGVTFGVKLPSGDFKYARFDRDTSIGTGSTDLLLGGYHLGALNKANTLSYFGQALWDRPVSSQGGYRPGQELDAAAGVIYTGFSVGKVTIAPLAQVIGSHRDADAGSAANPPDSGYDRVLLSPGVEVDYKAWRAYADVEVPVYQRFTGNQLAAPELLKVIFSRSF